MFADDALWTLRSRPPKPFLMCARSAALSPEQADVGLNPADYKPLYLSYTVDTNYYLLHGKPLSIY